MERSGVAILVNREEMPMAELKPLLERQGSAPRHARTCVDVMTALRCVVRPMLIFTETVFADGMWVDVVGLAARAQPAVPVIVVHRFVDVHLYLNVLEGGAADFLVPPFRKSDLEHVIRVALSGAAGRALESSAAAKVFA